MNSFRYNFFFYILLLLNNGKKILQFKIIQTASPRILYYLFSKIKK